MGFLARLYAGLTAPQIDINFGDEELSKARRKISLGEYKPAMALMAATTEHNQRAFRAETLANWLGRPDAFELWLEEHPEDPNANLISARHLINWAWEARGGGLGNTVSEKAAQLFIERLVLAGRQLGFTLQHAPNDPTPLAALIIVAKGLNQPKEDTAEIFNKTIEIEPDHHAAHYAMIDFLCGKWHGSHEEMFEFARNAVANAKPGSSLHGLIAFAHLERWVDVGNDDADDNWSETYWEQPDIKSELCSASEALLATNAALTPCQLIAGNYLAMGLSLAKEFGAANRTFQALGDYFSEAPWSYIGEPGNCYNIWRRDARKQSS